MDKEPKLRTNEFRWESRYELYSYFKEKHGMEREDVDREIQRVMARFRPRKGQSIHTKELWQKVGTDLERSLGGYIPSKQDNDEVVFEVSAPEGGAATGGQKIETTAKKSPQETKTPDLVIQDDELPPQPVIEIDVPLHDETGSSTSLEKLDNATKESSSQADDDDDVAYLDLMK